MLLLPRFSDSLWSVSLAPLSPVYFHVFSTCVFARVLGLLPSLSRLRFLGYTCLWL